MKNLRIYICALVILLLNAPTLSIFAAEEEQKPNPPTIEKSVTPTIAQAGDILQYTIIVRNLNDAWVGEHIMRDSFPANKIRPYMDTLTVMRDGVQLTGGHTVADSFLLYGYCLTDGNIEVLFYGLPPLSETIITFESRVLPSVTFDTKIVNEATIWFAIWVPGPWNPETGMPDPGHHNRGEYPVGECYAVANMPPDDGNDDGNGNDTGNDGGGFPPFWHPPRGGISQPPRTPTYTPPYIPSAPPQYTSADSPDSLPPLPPPLYVAYVLLDDTLAQPCDYVLTEPDDGEPSEPTHQTDATINPQTGDDFAITRLAVSAVGLILSLSAVFFLFLKLRRH